MADARPTSVDIGLTAVRVLRAAAAAPTGDDAVLDTRLSLADLDPDEVVRVAAALAEIGARRLPRPLARGGWLRDVLETLEAEWSWLGS